MASPPKSRSQKAIFFLSLMEAFILVPTANSVNFTISHFEKNTSTISYEGDATTYNGAILLNRIDYLPRVGRAVYINPIRIWEPSTKKVSDFSTNFSFSIDTLGNPKYGHGISFFLAPIDSQIPYNSDGGFLGLYNTTTLVSPSENHIVSVELDSFPNPQWDQPYEHVGINVNGLASAKYVRWNASMHSGQTGKASIRYSSSSKTLDVAISYEDGPGNYNLSYEIDLVKILPEWIKIGFSTATGINIERNTIYSWDFSSTFDTKYEVPSKRSKDEVNLWLVLSVCLMGGLVFILISFIIFSRNKRRHNRNEPEVLNVSSINNVLDRGAWPRRFSNQELVTATNNFSEEKKLGQGGFGCVYKGNLSDLGMEVAVKKILSNSKQGKREYMTEVLTISCLRHRNLVRLLGWCHDQGEFMLVYEFMPNGSLDTHLFGNNTSLSWGVRYKVVQGLASALLYLHEEWEKCVVHRDIKSSNVMLDSGFNAKLGDFGLARLMDHEVSLQTTALAGTWGYLAPEYVTKGKASKESDVYSFGIVALEIACGRKTVDHDAEESRVRLVEWVWGLYEKGRIVEAVDGRLGVGFDVKQMKCLMVVGLWCAHPDHTLRPSIRLAIQALNFEARLPELPLKMPVPVYGTAIPFRTGQSSENSITCTSVEMGR